MRRISFAVLSVCLIAWGCNGAAPAGFDGGTDSDTDTDLCSPLDPLTCDTTVPGNNGAAGSTDIMDSYPACIGWDETGPEYSYSFVAPADAHLVLNLASVTADVDIFVLSDDGTVCSAAGCVAYGNYTAWLDVSEGEAYYVVLDGYQGVVGDYSLEVHCLPACAGNGHDEDGDGLDDDCDNCPTYYNPMQDNADGDDIGDACEWSGNTGVLDTITVFDPLMASITIPPWTPDSPGSWTWGADTYSGSNTGGTNTVHGTSVSVPFSAEASLYYPGDAADSENWASLLFGYTSSTSWFQCDFAWDSKQLEIRQGTTNLAWVTTTDTADRDVSRRIRVYFSGTGDFVCTLQNDTQGTVGTVSATLPSAGTMTHHGGLRVYRETAAFESFVLYE